MIGQFTIFRDINLPEDPQLAALCPFYEIARMPLARGAVLCAALPGPGADRRWPGFPRAASPASGRVAMGCGTSLAAALRSALGEAAELAQACAWGDEPLVRATPAEMAGHALLPETLDGFSAAQRADRRAVNAWLSWQDWMPPAARATRSIAWLTAEDAAGGPPVPVPADVVLIGRRAPGDRQAVAVANSSGCACGSTTEAARLAAVFERVERDAAARWWFGRRTRATLHPDLLSEWPDLLETLLRRDRRFRLFDITTDIGIPTIAAASFAPDGTGVALGFAARSRSADAACSAALEMLAVETTLPPWREPQDPHMNRWLAQAHADMPPLRHTAFAQPPASLPAQGGAEALALAVGAVQAAGCRLLFLDHSRPDWSLPVARAISPDLCALSPRFGLPRLTARDTRDLAPPLPWPDPARPLLIPL
jgi:ribosomal protein S12 methylthiotransferase accessory factor